MAKKLRLAVGCLVALGWATSASAVPIVEFGPGGTVTITNTAISGSLISLGNSQLLGASLADFPVPGTLSFTASNAAPNFVILGDIPAFGGPAAFGSAGTPVALLTGSIANWTWDLPNTELRVLGDDAKRSDLLTGLGLSPLRPFAYFGTRTPVEFTLYGNAVPGIPNTFFATSYQIGPSGGIGSVDGITSPTVIPEPGSMLLLGSGLIGLASAVRRRMRK